MMRMKTRPTGMSPMNGGLRVGGAAGGGETGSEWELRPGGMLVQKRNPDSDRNSIPPPTIRVRVKYGSKYHEISISSQATFGNSYNLPPTQLRNFFSSGLVIRLSNQCFNISSQEWMGNLSRW